MAVSQFQREYGGMIWTNHAIERLAKRRIYQDQALSVMRNPDKTFPGDKEGTVKFIRTLNNRRVHLVAKLDESKKWIVLTAWVRGEEDKHGFPEKYVYRLVDWVARRVGKVIKGKRVRAGS